jgi:putative ABC transport system permease protein
MNLLTFSIKNIFKNPLDFILNIILLAFGTSIITALFIAGAQFENILTTYSRGIDLVVGAKGSPMQLILSNVYHVDFPTGNISYNKATELAKHPLIEKAVPLSLGDSYQSFRIAGTDEGFFDLYSLKLREGRVNEDLFEAVIGAKAASSSGLKTGDTFHSSHGITDGGHQHHHDFIITGILEESYSPADNLILTSLDTYWHLHDVEEEDEKEITSLLIQYRSPLAIASLPGYINQKTNFQAASPALESARLMALTGSLLEAFNIFAVLLIILATFSIFIALYRALANKTEEIALMRILGAGRKKVSLSVLLEGLVLSATGTLAGILLGHLGIELISMVLLKQSQIILTGFTFVQEEILVFISGIAAGIIASVIPSVKAYRKDVSGILGK